MATESRRQARGVQQSPYEWKVLRYVAGVAVIALFLDPFSVDPWFAGWANAGLLECAHWMSWDMDEG